MNLYNPYIGCEGSVLTADGSILVLAPGNMGGTYVVPDTVTELYEGVFLGSALTSIDVGDAVSEIPRMVFRDSAELVSIRIGPSVSYISYDVFDGCASLLCIDVSPDNPEYSSEDGILYDHDRTTLIRCPQGISGSLTIDMPVRTVEDGAFWGCSLLTHVEFPDGLTSIKSYAFLRCSALTSITLPASLTSIEYRAFRYCRSLKTVTCLAATPPGLGTDAFENCDALTAIQVPAASVDAYQAASEWSNYADKIVAIEP